MVYRKIKINITIALAKLNAVVVEKLISFMSTVALLWLLLNNEMPAHKAKQIKNTRPTLSINGNSGQNTLSSTEKRAEPIAANKAPSALVRFQNMPSKKITTMPGVKKPVNS
jgi:hypothetical protein